MMKRCISIVSVVLLVIVMIVPVQAATITPRYTYIFALFAGLEIDTTWGIATCEGEITARNSYPVKINMYLQQYKNGQWVTLKSWTSEDLQNAALTRHYAIDQGYKYRIYVEGYVYNSNGQIIETTSMVDEEIY